MRRLGVEHVGDLAAERAERHEQLLGVARRAALVGLALQEQERRADGGDVPQRRLPPQQLDALRRRGVADAGGREYVGPQSEPAHDETLLATPFSDTAAANRSDVPTSQLARKPP